MRQSQFCTPKHIQMDPLPKRQPAGREPRGDRRRAIGLDGRDGPPVRPQAEGRVVVSRARSNASRPGASLAAIGGGQWPRRARRPRCARKPRGASSSRERAQTPAGRARASRRSAAGNRPRRARRAAPAAASRMARRRLASALKRQPAGREPRGDRWRAIGLDGRDGPPLRPQAAWRARSRRRPFGFRFDCLLALRIGLLGIGIARPFGFRQNQTEKVVRVFVKTVAGQWAPEELNPLPPRRDASERGARCIGELASRLALLCSTCAQATLSARRAPLLALNLKQR
jgi:hypothetical protein